MSEVQESEATYVEVSAPTMVKETFEMEENRCYGSSGVAPQKKAVDSGSNKNVTVALIATIVLLVILILL